MTARAASAAGTLDCVPPNSGKVELLLGSGASRRTEVDEATNMKEALIEQGVPAECIVRDPHGYRPLSLVTRTNPTYSWQNVSILFIFMGFY